VKRTYYQVDGGPLQIGTTVVVPGPESGTATHTIEFWSLDNRCNTERPHKKATFVVFASETIPPVTMSDARETYLGDAVITLSATDAGGSGVASTHYRVDGGAVQAGSTVTVPAGPYGSPVAHTLEFWSVDGAGNEEVPHGSASFTIAMPADESPPVTTSDARDTYSGAAAIELTPTDPGGSGVAATYYRLDGGDAQSGTTVLVDPPTSGSAAHTLEFWSIDSEGNTESPPKTETFTVWPTGTGGTITLLWDAQWDSWAKYWIYDADGNLVLYASSADIPGWDGDFTCWVPIDSRPYYWYSEWYDDWEYLDGTTSGFALIDEPGEAYSSYY
jgi:hypothetical protein